MFVLVPTLSTNHNRPRPPQPPKYRAIQISFDGLGSQGKSGDWQILKSLILVFYCQEWYNAAYATAAVDALLGKWECLHYDSTALSLNAKASTKNRTFKKLEPEKLTRKLNNNNSCALLGADSYIWRKKSEIIRAKLINLFCIFFYFFLPLLFSF